MAGIFDRFLGRKREFSLLDYSGYSEGVPAWPVRDFATLAKEGYVENATAYACITAIGLAMAGIQWKVYKPKKGADGKRTAYDEHPLLKLLANPNSGQTASEFTAAELAYLKINGTSFTVLTGMPLDISMPLSKPIAMLLPRPDLVRPIPDALGIPRKYRIGMSSESAMLDYDASRVIQRRAFHPLNPIFGLAPLEVAAKDIDILNANTDYLYRLAKRNGRPDGVIISNGAFKDEQFDRLKKQIDANFNNAKKSGGFVLLEGIVKEIKEFAFKPSEMNLTAGELRRVSSVCSVFGVPPEIIGVAEAKTYSNYKEARQSFYTECVLPEMDALREKRQVTLMKFFSDSDVLDYDRDNIEALQEDRDKVWTRALAAEQAGAITNNEYRNIVGLPRSLDPLADVRMVSMLRVPADILLDQVTATPEGTEDEPEEEGGEPKEKKGRTNLEALPMLRATAGPQLWRAFDLARIPFERNAAGIMRTRLMMDYARAAQAIIAASAGTTTSAESAVRDALQANKTLWATTMRLLYQNVGSYFAQRVDAGLKESIGEVGLAKRAKADSWSQRIAGYLEKQLGTKITGIGDTTRKGIMDVVAKGFAEGLGAEAIGRLIEEAAPRAARDRGLRIARTEVMTASNLGSDAAARAFGVPLVKFWLATDDGRERETHAEADSQERSLDDSFQVGGDDMLFPGDSTLGAGADEIINCRCAVTYAVKED